MVAAHTDLPVIGVPLTSKTSVAGGLDALLAIAQMPPGVPVATVGVDNPKNAAVLAARILSCEGAVIERYTRPEMGAVWSERRKFDTWLQVELAVVDALAEQGVVPRRTPRRSATGRRSRSRRSRSASRSRTTTWPPSWTWSRARWARRDAGFTTASPPRTCSTPRSAPALPGGDDPGGGAADYRNALVRRAREHVNTLCVGRTHGVHAEPTTFGVKLAGFAFEAHRNLIRLERAAEAVSVGALSGAVGTYAANGPEVEEAC